MFKQQNNLQYRIRTDCTVVYETHAWKNEHTLLCQLDLLGVNTAKNNNSPIRGWFEKFSGSTTDGKTIGKIFFPKLVHLS
jgi:hypothetical protein